MCPSSKGSVEFACIEDVITEMEEEIAETDDTFTEDQIHEIVMDAFMIDQWPADPPDIYFRTSSCRLPRNRSEPN